MRTRNAPDGRRIPNSVSIELSSVCNRRCRWCPQSVYQRPLGELPVELFRKIVDDLSADGFDVPMELHFFNEPLLYYKMLLECLSYLTVCML